MPNFTQIFCSLKMNIQTPIRAKYELIQGLKMMEPQTFYAFNFP